MYYSLVSIRGLGPCDPSSNLGIPIFLKMKKRLRIITGSKLSKEEVITINRIFQDAFSNKNTLEIGTKKQYEKNIFFILAEGKKILSIARLRQTKITFMGKKYDVLGIGDMVSVTERRGYGKKVMGAIHKYAQSRKEICFGYCKRINSPFYQKSGFKIINNLVRRFIYINSDGKVVKNSFDNDLIVHPKDKNFIAMLLKNSKEKVLLEHPFF